MLHLGGRGEGGEAERATWADLEADAHALALDVGVDERLAVEPDLDALGLDAQAGGVPLALLELRHGAGGVVVGVLAVEAGDAADRPAPAAEDQRRVRVADGEGEPDEEVGAGDATGLDLELIVGPGHLAAGVGDAGQPVGHGDGEGAVLADGGFQLSAIAGLAPAVERLAVEQIGPAGLVVVGCGLLVGRVEREDEGAHKESDAQECGGGGSHVQDCTVGHVATWPHSGRKGEHG